MKRIDPAELKAMFDADQPVEIIDVRSRAAFLKSHINGAHSHPAAEISAEALVLGRELLATEPLYLVSQSGASAESCAGALERDGFDNVVVVDGGMNACTRHALPIARQPID